MKSEQLQDDRPLLPAPQEEGPEDTLMVQGKEGDVALPHTPYNIRPSYREHQPEGMLDDSAGLGWKSGHFQFCSY